MRALIITNRITSRDEKSIEKYLNEISKFEVLSPSEEIALFKSYRSGDESALNKIMNHNLRFVVSVAKQYQHTGLRLGDLINEGNIGLIEAAQRFDETRGFKFISYAVWWIRQAIISAINKKGKKIRLPQNLRTVQKEIADVTRDILQKTEREPTLLELAEKTGYSEKKVVKCLEMNKKCRSLDAPMEAGEDYSLGSLLEDTQIDRPDHEVVERESNSLQVQSLLKKIPIKEATVLSMYFGINRKYPMTLNDIGDYMGISRERVRQVRDRALKRLRIKLRRRELVV